MRDTFLRTLVIALSLWFSQQLLAQADIEVTKASISALGIETAIVRAGVATASASAIGLVIARPGTSRTVTIPFDAVMVEPLILPGMQATAGQAIALLQSTDYTNAHADLETKRFTAEHTEELAQRAVELGQLGLRSKEEIDEALHEAESARLKFNAIASNLSDLKSALGAGRFVLSSPSDGIVTHISAEAGEPVLDSEPLVKLFEGTSYWARVQLPETKASKIAIGDNVFTDRHADVATVVAIDPEIAPASRSVEVYVDLPKGEVWRIGQLVNMTFTPSEMQSGALTVPARSIVRINSDVFVFVKTESGFRAVPITIQSKSRDSVAVTGSLTVGAHVAISGLAALKNIMVGG